MDGIHFFFFSFREFASKVLTCQGLSPCQAGTQSRRKLPEASKRRNVRRKLCHEKHGFHERWRTIWAERKEYDSPSSTSRVSQRGENVWPRRNSLWIASPVHWATAEIKKKVEDGGHVVIVVVKNQTSYLEIEDGNLSWKTISFIRRLSDVFTSMI